MTGRFAPSPTSALHLGNLRTAVLAWLFARSAGQGFRLRMEDLDTSRIQAAPSIGRGQLQDLTALGLEFDPPVVWQSDRLEAYHAAIDTLDTYECFCTRREIAEAASAPHGDGYRPYPRTCRTLSAEQADRLRATRRPALRVRAAEALSTVHDRFAGTVTQVVDDFVVLRNDGVPAYNLAVVVDDLAMGIDQVVRGDDLLSSAPRQAWLAARLGGRPPEYVHVPLAVNTRGIRLAKRDGAVTLADLASTGISPQRVLGLVAHSLTLATPGEPVTPRLLLDRFDPDTLPRSPWVVDPARYAE